MSDHHDLDATSADQKRVLLQVLGLNVGLSALLLAGGLLADSSGLLANALDNGSDALTYAISYLAVTRTAIWKARAARITAVMLLVLAVGV
ncbi:MAG: cation transporter, partial [Burkholderiales bacterium]|nr:cation transporter [Burkholderiales bacterium]